MTFPHKTSLIVIVVVASLQLVSSRGSQAQTPPPPVSHPTKEKAADYSQEALVVEQLRVTYRFEKDGTGQHELSLRVKVQSEAALERFGQLVLPYISANEKLDIDYVRVKKPDGSIISASESDVQDLTA